MTKFPLDRMKGKFVLNVAFSTESVLKIASVEEKYSREGVSGHLYLTYTIRLWKVLNLNKRPVYGLKDLPTNVRGTGGRVTSILTDRLSSRKKSHMNFTFTTKGLGHILTRVQYSKTRLQPKRVNQITVILDFRLLTETMVKFHRR